MMHRQRQDESDELMQFLDKEEFEENNFINYTSSPRLNLYNLHLLKNKYHNELKNTEFIEFRDKVMKMVDTKLLYTKNQPIPDSNAPIKISIRSNMQRFRRYKAIIHQEEQPQFLQKQQKFGFSLQVKETSCPLEVQTISFKSSKELKQAETIPFIYRAKLKHGFRGMQ